MARNAFQLTLQEFVCKWLPKAYSCFLKNPIYSQEILFTLLMGTFSTYKSSEIQINKALLSTKNLACG